MESNHLSFMTKPELPFSHPLSPGSFSGLCRTAVCKPLFYRESCSCQVPHTVTRLSRWICPRTRAARGCAVWRPQHLTSLDVSIHTGFLQQYSNSRAVTESPSLILHGILCICDLRKKLKVGLLTFSVYQFGFFFTFSDAFRLSEFKK